MSTLSLDLRGVEASHALPQEATAKGAGLSLLLHTVSISALLLGSLLQTTSLPQVANAMAAPLTRPITVMLPPAPIRVTPLPHGSSARPTRSLAVAPNPPTDIPTALNPAFAPDPGVTSDRFEIDARPNGSPDGACPLGSVCGASTAPLDPPPTPLVRIGGAIREPRLAESRAPVYPPVAQAAGVSGTVVLEAHVGQDGRVIEVRITQSHALFDAAALASVRSRRYEPLLLNGVPTEFLVTITVTFNLRR